MIKGSTRPLEKRGLVEKHGKGPRLDPFCIFLPLIDEKGGKAFGMTHFDPFYFTFNNGARVEHFYSLLDEENDLFHSQIKRYRIPKITKKDNITPLNPFTAAFGAAKPEVNVDEKKTSENVPMKVDAGVKNVVTRAERLNFLHITTAAKMQEKMGGFTAEETAGVPGITIAARD